MTAGWPFVGRSEVLRAVLAAAAGHRGGGLVLSGRMGLGKTRALSEVSQALREAGYEVLTVRATMSAASVQLAAVQLLLPLERGHPSHREMLAAALNQLRDRNSKAGGRLTLAVDDAHLLDEASAALVHAVCADSGPLTVVTVNPDAAAPDAIAALWKDLDAEVVELRPLAHEEVAALLERALGGPVEGRTVHRIAVWAGGVPLLVRETVRVAVDHGHLAPGEDGLWRLSDAAPPSPRLTQMIIDRVAELDLGARTVVDLLALAGPLPVTLLTALCGRDAVLTAEATALLRLDPAGRRRSVRLEHQSFADVLAAAVPPLRTQHLYGRLADELATTGLRRAGDPALLAGWQLAAGRQPDRAGLVAAVLAAQEHGDHPLALELAGLTGPDDHLDPATVFRLRAACATSSLWLGRSAESDAYFGRALAAAPPEDREPLLVGRAYNLFLGAGHVAAAENVLASVALGPGVGGVAALRALFLVSAGRMADVLAFRAEAGVLERPIEAAYVSALTWHGRPVDAVAAARAAERLPAVAVAPVGLLESVACTAMAMAGELPAARSRARLGYAAALEAAEPGGIAMWAFCLGNLLLWWGYPLEAAPLLTEAATTMATRPTGLGPAAHLHCLGNLAEARALTGDAAGARRALTEIRLVPAGDCSSPASGIGIAWTLAAEDRLDQARTVLRETAVEAERLGNLLAGGRALLDLVRLGDPDAATRLRTLAARIQGPLPAAWVAFTAAARSSGDSAVGHLDRAGLPLLAAEAACAAAAARRSRDPVGAQRLAVRAGRLLNDLGVDAPWLGPLETALLTHREAQIARLAALGLPSLEIAGDLHVSVRTVDSHLSRVYRKLEIHDRHDLPAALRAVLPPPSDR